MYQLLNSGNSQKIMKFNQNNQQKANTIPKYLKDLLFEKTVIDNLDPEKHNLEGLYFFKKYDIGKTISIPRFFPKSKQNIILENKNKLSFKNKSFLLKNDLCENNKLIDAIFVNVNENNEAEIHCFFIKPQIIKRDISQNYLDENLHIMKQYLNNLFNFKINSIYFTIIYDFNLAKRRDITKFFNKRIYFIFFDMESLAFKDIHGHNINKNKSISLLSQRNTKVINNFKIDKIKILKKNFELNIEQKGTIKELLRKINKKLNNNFYYFKSDILYITNINNFKTFCITEQPKYIFNTDNPETYMLYKGEDRNLNFIKLNKKGGYELVSELIYGLCSSNEYDYYKIE